MSNFIVTLILFILCETLLCQRYISITIDDPNTYETPILNWEERDKAIRGSLAKYKIKTGLFVCGKRIDNSNGRKLIANWDRENHMICNHTYSHYYFNSPAKTAENFIQDFLKNDSIIRLYKNYTKLLRFPFLKEGNTIDKRDSMREILKKTNYRNGHVTIDASDWYIDTKMIEAIKKDSNVDLRPYKQYYIEHILNRVAHYDSLSKRIFGRQIKHNLLIHHSLLNALYLSDVLLELKKKGWQLIDAKEAFSDSTYLLKPNIIPCGESIIWQSAKLDSHLSPALRYPAEDGQYEEKGLQDMIEKYNKRANESIKLKIDSLTKDFYIYTTYGEFKNIKFPSNGMYILTDSGAIMVDNPWDTTQFQPLLDSIYAKHQKKVKLVISTHYHNDRTAGLEYYAQKGIRTYSSIYTYELCRKFKEKQSEYFFTKDTIFRFGNYTMETYYPGGGHTKDNIVLWFAEKKVLYGGCLVKSLDSENLGNLRDADLASWSSSVRNVMMRYPFPGFIIPGHQSWKSKESLPYTLRLLKAMNKK